MTRLELGILNAMAELAVKFSHPTRDNFYYPEAVRPRCGSLLLAACTISIYAENL